VNICGGDRKERRLYTVALRPGDQLETDGIFVFTSDLVERLPYHRCRLNVNQDEARQVST
jgi:hypothetical protein